MTSESQSATSTLTTRNEKKTHREREREREREESERAGEKDRVGMCLCVRVTVIWWLMLRQMHIELLHAAVCCLRKMTDDCQGTSTTQTSVTYLLANLLDARPTTAH